MMKTFCHLLSGLIILLASALPLAANSQDVVHPTEQLIVDPEFTLPDMSGQWEQYLANLKTLKVRIDELERLVDSEDGSLRDRLASDIAAARTEIERAEARMAFLASHKTSTRVWTDLQADRYSGVDRAVLGWAMINSRHRKLAGKGYIMMSETFVRRNDLFTAINIAARGKTVIKGRDLRTLSDDFRRYLDMATLRVGNATYDLTGASPVVCFAMGQWLQEEQDLPLTDYVRASDGRTLAVTIRSSDLCLGGMDYGESLNVTLRRGLRAGNGAVLARDADRPVTIASRSPSARFDGANWIAPINGDETVALHSVNMESADLRLYRVGERAIRQLMMQGLYQTNAAKYMAENIGNSSGETVWSGSVDIESKANQQVTTLVPLRDMIEALEPGLYILQADWKSDEKRPWARRNEQRPLQWILFSDTGLTVIRGNDGLTVSSRYLSSARPRKGVELSLVAQNNEVLASLKTDRKGIARFDAGLIRGEGGNRPSHLVADGGDGDFTILRLGQDGLDLSDFDIGGRRPNEAGDLYLFTERPVYRAGETVHLTGFLRDLEAKAISGRKLSFKLIRPDGTEDRNFDLTGGNLGGYASEIALHSAARTGRWHLQARYQGSDTMLGGVSFEVQDFVPLRLKSSLTASTDIMTPEGPVDLTLESSFLYGAPAAGLKSTVNASISTDPQPFKGYETFTFGLVDDSFSLRQIGSDTGKLSATGTRSVAIESTQPVRTSLPLAANVVATTFDVGGRPVYARLKVPFRHEDTSVGARIIATEKRNDVNLVSAELVALDAAGEPIEGRNLTVRLIREHYRWQWYQLRGRWQSKPVIRDEPVFETRGVTTADGLLAIEQELGRGAWRIEVDDADGTSRASRRFHVGWWAWDRRANEPDQLTLKLASSDMQSGKTLRGSLEAPFDGDATVMVMTDRVHHISRVSVKNGEAEFSLKVGNDWGPGAWLMVTAFRPVEDNPAATEHLPVRATGFAWFDIDKKGRSLTVDINAPDTVLPRRTATIPVKIDGLSAGDTAKVTMLAVDEGILSLMRFKSPSLSEHYLAKKGLGVSVMDLYGRLLLTKDGRRGTVRTGGDAAFESVMVTGSRVMDKTDNRAGLTTRSRRAVALVTRDVTVGADGQAEVRMDMPDFVGQLRLMAIAWSEQKMGEAQEPLIVRDPVAADLILPRFMAPGDIAHPQVSITNLSGGPLELDVALESDGAVSAELAATGHFTLADGERRDIPVRLAATTVGIADFRLKVTGAKEPVERTWQMQVRPAFGFATRASTRMLGGDETLTLTPDQGLVDRSQFIPGTSFAKAQVSLLPDLKTGEMMESLHIYPYYCTEQTVSRAMPMLYGDRLVAAGLSGKQTNAFNADLDSAIQTLLMRQQRRGDFGMWRAGGNTNDWASLYALDFLMQARQQGLHVPADAIRRGLDWIGTFRAGRTHHSLMSYGLYLQARAGVASRGDVRHYGSTATKTSNKPLADAQLAAALALVGEQRLARQRFELALGSLYKYDSSRNFYDYGSQLRDRAGVITLLAESKTGRDLLMEAGDALSVMVSENRWFNTQVQAWLVRAAATLTGGEPLSIQVNGETSPALKATWTGWIKDTMAITNNSSMPVRLQETVRGGLAHAPAKEANGATIIRRYIDLEGNDIDPMAIRQNDRFIVLVSGNLRRVGTEASLVLDMLPAGLEIENATVGGESALGEYDFLPHLTRTVYRSELDDRYFAVLDNRRSGPFTLAYMVRAVTPGEYVQAPVSVEDMYEPQYRAVGIGGTVVIAPGE